MITTLRSTFTNERSRHENVIFSTKERVRISTGRTGLSAEGGRVVDLFVHGFLNENTKRGNCSSKFRIWAEKREKVRQGLWPYDENGAEFAVRELTVFMTSSCLAHKNQSGTIRGYLAAIKYSHQLYAGCDLPTSRFRVLAVSKSKETYVN